jgi:DNA-binding NtrC family response regulator
MMNERETTHKGGTAMSATTSHVLVIDDEKHIRDAVADVLDMKKGCIASVGNAEDAMLLIEQDSYDLILLDLRLPGMSGIEFLKHVKKRCSETDVIVITGYATLDIAVEAMREGACDFVPKPFTSSELRNVVSRAAEKRRLALQGELYEYARSSEDGCDMVIGESKSFLDVFKTIKKVSLTDCTVLIAGESGTGKQLVAREIHRFSNRRDKPFVTVDCGVVVETLFESELFGHVKGAYTGATETRHGLFHLADGGTIFLDEITNIDLNIQAKLLRAIQEREIKPVGRDTSVKVDVRIIAATNQSLEEEVSKGRFREDLYYRLSVFPVQLPPLRERKEDIPHLANYFVRRIASTSRRSVNGISDDAMDILVNYRWPGNIRELENIIERAVIIEESPVITTRSVSVLTEPNPKSGARLYAMNITLEELEKNYILHVLKRCGWKKTRAAEILGLDRKSLYNRIQKYNLDESHEAPDFPF